MEINYEHNNEEVLEKFCLVMEFKAAKEKESKADALETRLSIEAILEKRALREIIELCC